jgi:hypothetical protein
LADNYVSIRIKASDTAKPDLTDLKLKLDELGHKVETAKVEVDDEDASVKLLRMNARLAELNAKVANPRVKVAGAARAEAEILALDHELDKLNRKADDAGPTGLIGKIVAGTGGMVPSGGIFGTLLGPWGLAIVPAIGAIATELVGLASGFAAAGAGAGAFALLAKPAIGQVTTAYQGLNAAHQKYQNALDLQKLDPTKAHAAAVKSAMDQLMLAGSAIGKLPDSEQKAVDGLFQLRTEFGKISSAFAPEAFKVFASGLKVVNNLLPALTPFANSFANALDGLLKQAGKFTQSQGFQEWLKQFQKLTGPAVTAIGHGFGQVAIQLGKLLTLMSQKDVVNAINIAFTVLADTVGAITFGIRRFMQNYDSMSSAVRRDSHDIASAFDAIRHAAAAWAEGMARDVGQVVSFFLRLPGRILGAVASLPGRLRSAGVNAIAGLLNGLVSEAGRVIGYVENFASNIANAFSSVLHIFSPSKVFEQHGKMIAAGLIQGMDGSRGLVTAAAGRLATSTIPGRYPAQGGGAGGGATVKVQLEWVGGGSDELMRLIRNRVRIAGGDPTMFQRKVAFQ